MSGGKPSPRGGGVLALLWVPHPCGARGGGWALGSLSSWGWPMVGWGWRGYGVPSNPTFCGSLTSSFHVVVAFVGC